MIVCTSDGWVELRGGWDIEEKLMNKVRSELGDGRKGSRPDKGGFVETFTELGQAGHVKVAGKRCEVSIQCGALMEEVDSSTEELPLPKPSCSFCPKASLP